MADDIVQTNIDISATDRTGQVLSNLAENLKKVNGAAAGALTGPLNKTADAAKKAGDAVSEHIGSRTKQAMSGASVAAGAFLERLSPIPLSYAAAGVAAEEFARRSLLGFAQVQRGMESIQFSTGATGEQMRKLGEQFDDMAAITGRSVEQLQNDFTAFMATSNDGVDKAAQTFRDIGIAATASGTSLEAMGRAAGAAFSNLRISSEADRQAVLGAWVTEVPTAIMDAWTQVAPRLTQEMASMGFSGRQAAIDMAGMFQQVAGSLGSTRLAATSLSEVLSKMSSLSDPLGQVMLPTLERIREQGGSSLDAMKALVDQLARAGAFTSNLVQRASIRQAFGIDDQTLRSLQVLHDHFADIKRVVDSTGMSWDRAVALVEHRSNDAEGSINRLVAEFGKLEDEFGGFLEQIGADQALQGLAATFRAIADSIAIIKDGMQWIGDHMPDAQKPVQVPAGQAAAAARGQTVTGTVPIQEGGAATYQYIPFTTTWFANLFDMLHQGRESLEAEPKPDATKPQADAIKPENLPHFAQGAIVSRPTVAVVGDADVPEIIAPIRGGLSPGNSGASTATEKNTEATSDNTSALNRLGTYLRDFAREHRGFAFTPGAGGAATPDVAGLLPHWQAGDVYASLGGGGAGPSGDIAGGGAPAAEAAPSGGSWWQHVGPPLPGGSPTQGSPAPGGVIGPEGGVAPGPQATPEGVVPRQGRAAPQGAPTGPPTGAAGILDRSRFAAELKAKPWLRDKIMRIAANEQGSNPQGTQAVLESMMNRAAVRGTSLEAQATWHNPRTGAGYYQMGSMGRGALEDPRSRAVLEQSLGGALGGSNLSNYATDNASGDLARREAVTGRFRYRQQIHGETFFAPGTAEPGLARSWDSWMAGAQGGSAPVADRGNIATQNTNDGTSGGAAGRGDATGGVPENILATARQVALHGGPGAVQSFMAQQGYPRAGNWCGEFAASVVHAAGGTPPRNPAIASNWRNWGTPDATPHPGDVAVRRGAPTGSTGSHVTFVEGSDPRTGRFTGLGGNQRAGFESQFPTSGYEFRRPPAPPQQQADRGNISTQSAAHPPSHFETMLRAHRAMRQEMEKPIKTSFAPPARPSASTQRRQIANREARWRSEAMMGQERYAAQADIGVA